MKSKRNLLLICELLVVIMFAGIPIFLASCVHQVDPKPDPHSLPVLPFPYSVPKLFEQDKPRFLIELTRVVEENSLKPFFTKVYEGKFFLKQKNYSYSVLFPGLYNIDRNTIDTAPHYDFSGDKFQEFNLDYYYNPDEEKELLVYEVPTFVSERLCLAFIYSQNGRLSNLRGLCALETLRPYVSLNEDLTCPLPTSFSVFKCNDVLSPEDCFSEGREMRYRKERLILMDYDYWSTLALASDSWNGYGDNEKKYIFFFRD